MNLLLKYLALGFVGLTLFASCTETRYKEPQPFEKKEKRSFPKKMQGTFIDEDGDTFKIESARIVGPVDNIGRTNSEIIEISDSIKVKKHKGYCFLNALADNNHWNVFLVDYSGRTNIHVYGIAPKTKRLRDLKRITKVEEFRNEKGKLKYILLNPTKREWKHIIKEEIPELVYSYRRIE
ncbi:MAG: hypothetical protein JXQ87_05050 [Bacteroidia bacterium]